jgi:hypothetical protein
MTTDDESPTRLPAPLDRSALERVLARAAELQGSGGDGSDGALTEAQLLEVGREVGLDAASLRQALAEERTRVAVPEAGGVAGRLAGPAVATASRVVNGTPESLLATLDDWMQREECLKVRRRHAGRMTWEAQRGLVAQAKRALGPRGRGYDLARAGEVGATVAAVDATRTVVRLDADLGPARTAALRAGAASAATGAAAAAAVGVVGTVAGAALLALLPLAVVPAIAGIGAGAAVAGRHRSTAARAQLALEQVLDRLEHGAARRPPTVLEIVDSVARRIR